MQLVIRLGLQFQINDDIKTDIGDDCLVKDIVEASFFDDKIVQMVTSQKNRSFSELDSMVLRLRPDGLEQRDQIFLMHWIQSQKLTELLHGFALKSGDTKIAANGVDAGVNEKTLRRVETRSNRASVESLVIVRHIVLLLEVLRHPFDGLIIELCDLNEPVWLALEHIAD